MAAPFGKPRRRGHIGRMRHRIVLHQREQIPPPFGSADFDEAFRDSRSRWCGIETKRGRAFFSGVNPRDVAITHEVRIRYDSQVTTETWGLLQSGERLEVVDVENVDNRSEWQILRCISHGFATAEASKT